MVHCVLTYILFSADVTIDVSSSLDHLDDDLHSGPAEVEEWTQKRMIQMKLGRRAGPRWSLPPEYIGKTRHLLKSQSFIKWLAYTILSSLYTQHID